MSANLQVEGETTKKYSLPLSHLDYTYIEKCTNIKELEKIVRILRSGEEGKFPDLEKFAEMKLEKLCPKSRALRKDGPILRPGDLSSGDWKSIEEDLKSWTNSMHDKDSVQPAKNLKIDETFIEGDENLPPVRSTNIVLEGKKQKIPEEKKMKKRVLPRDYKEWDKFDIEKELEKADSEEEKKKKQVSSQAKVKGISLDIDTSGLTQEEKEMKANREKDKGNEAFRSHDFEESVTYYSRSILLSPNSASYNNRALAYLKLEKWDKAIKDCNCVLNLEANNIKALLRRGTAYKSKKDVKKAVADFEKVLQMEPNNKKAEDLLKEVKKEMKKEEKERQERGGRRMVIEEVESDEEVDEEIEVEKPIVNGFGPHDHDKAENSSEAKREIPGKTLKTEASDNSYKPSGASSESHISDSVSGKSNQESETTSVKHSTAVDNSVLRKELTRESSRSESASDQENTISSITSTTSIMSSNKSQDAQTPSVNLTKPSPSLSENHSETSHASPQETSPQSGQSTHIETSDSPSPSVSFTLEESSQAATAAQVTSDPTDLSNPCPLSRPVYVQLPLPPSVLAMKEEGNKLFRSGQYGEAIVQYSQAINKLEKESEQQVNLSLLLSNRAACHLKTGNCSLAVSDCHLSLRHVPHSVKALLRRAAAFEALEKYADAYIDYKHVISVDRSTEQAHQGATRCQSALQQTYGSKTWREKIPPLVFVQPWEIPLITDQAGLHKSMSSTVSLAEQTKESEKASSPATQSYSSEKTKKENETSDKKIVRDGESQKNTSSKPNPQSTQATVQPTKEEEFEKVKAKGNLHVQKGEYQEALDCYSGCITLCPNQVACYTNRALCYLKLNKASEAETDCNKALSLQADNPKALYRRALARKMNQHYKQSLQDLIELLKLEPKNSAAQKEMDIVKKFYKEELEMLKQKKTEQESKVRKRMKIEEVDDDEEEEKPVRGKTTDKSKAQGKSRGGKMSQPSPGSKSKQSTAEKKPSQAHEASIQGQPVAPPIAPRLMKTTPYEFCQAWNSLKPCQGIQPYAEILRQVSPVDLHKVISNKLDGQMLQIIVRCVYEEMVLKGEVDLGYQMLDNLCQVPRFSTVAMFMTSKEKKEVSAVLDILSKTMSTTYTSADIVRLKKEYSVK